MSEVLSRLEDGVRTITLNRPERLNAMNAALLDGLAAALQAAEADPATRCIILTGAGRAFCAGDDLREHRHPSDEADARAAVARIQRVSEALLFGDRVAIAAVNGWAVGGGLEIAIGCDLAIWAESAQGFFPEMGWGMFVTGGVTALLPRLAGLARAKALILLGERQTAEAMLELGIAWRVVPDDRLMAEARSVAARIAALPPRAVRDLKRALNKAAFADLRSALDLETEATVRSFLDPETTQRIEPFGRT